MDLVKTACDGVDYIELALDRVYWWENVDELSGSIELLDILIT
jgi:hypothetical protein